MTRISDLPWVDYRINQVAAAQYWTQQLKTEYGTQELRPIQGAALNEAFWVGPANLGISGLMRCGCGKTLTSGLIPKVQNAQRPLLLLPGSLVEDTEDAFKALRLHWQIPLNIRIESYQLIGHKNHKDLLSKYAPDRIIADEAHFLANPESATVVKRVGEYLTQNQFGQHCAFSWMTGSGFGKTLLEIGHLISWSLKHLAPIPRDRAIQKMWADCLDQGVEESFRRTRGDLEILVPHLGEIARKSVEDAQRAFGVRFFHTPGVIISTDSFIGSGLEIMPIYLKHDATTERNFENLRNLWELPDGWILEAPGKAGSADAFSVYRVARQFKLGFYYAHDPRPPVDWSEARREHFSNVRYICQTFPEFDSPAIVVEAIEAGKIPWAEPSYRRWKAIEKSFVPNTVARWFSRTALDTCIKWGRSKAHSKKPSVIWTSHEVFGRAIAKETGWRFFEEEGKSSDGLQVKNCRDMNIICSTQANQEGRNLQFYADALVTHFNSGPKKTEQLLSRHHRDGQKADVVRYDYLVGCLEDVQAIERAYELASAVKRQSFEQEQKLCIATIRFPKREFMRGSAYDTTRTASQRSYKESA